MSRKRKLQDNFAIFYENLSLVFELSPKILINNYKKSETEKKNI